MTAQSMTMVIIISGAGLLVPVLIFLGWWIYALGQRTRSPRAAGWVFCGLLGLAVSWVAGKLIMMLAARAMGPSDLGLLSVGIQFGCGLINLASCSCLVRAAFIDRGRPPEEDSDYMTSYLPGDTQPSHADNNPFRTS